MLLLTQTDPYFRLSTGILSHELQVSCAETNWKYVEVTESNMQISEATIPPTVSSLTIRQLITKLFTGELIIPGAWSWKVGKQQKDPSLEHKAWLPHTHIYTTHIVDCTPIHPTNVIVRYDGGNRSREFVLLVFVLNVSDDFHDLTTLSFC